MRRHYSCARVSSPFDPRRPQGVPPAPVEAHVLDGSPLRHHVGLHAQVLQAEALGRANEVRPERTRRKRR